MLMVIDRSMKGYPQTCCTADGMRASRDDFQPVKVNKVERRIRRRRSGTTKARKWNTKRLNSCMKMGCLAKWHTSFSVIQVIRQLSGDDPCEMIRRTVKGHDGRSFTHGHGSSRGICFWKVFGLRWTDCYMSLGISWERRLRYVDH